VAQQPHVVAGAQATVLSLFEGNVTCSYAYDGLKAGRACHVVSWPECAGTTGVCDFAKAFGYGSTVLQYR
jgi:hypothetical protein